MIARLRDWLFRHHTSRHLPDPTFGPRMAAKRRQGLAHKQDVIRELKELGVDYGEINRAAFGRPPYSDRKGDRP